jgi:hypothetical protein
MADDLIVTDPSGITHSEQLNDLAAALSKAQAQITGARKDSANPFFKSKYADLASVWDACRKPLTDNGLAVIQAPSTLGAVGVTTMLLHSSGQWIAAHLSADPKDRGPQAIGSVITYLKRYALSGFAGVPQVDDDAEAGEARHTPPPVPREPGDEPPDDHEEPVTPAQQRIATPVPGSPTISEKQQKRLFAIAKGAGWTTETLKTRLQSYGYAHTRDIPVAHYDDIIADLEAAGGKA